MEEIENMWDGNIKEESRIAIEMNEDLGQQEMTVEQRSNDDPDTNLPPQTRSREIVQENEWVMGKALEHQRNGRPKRRCGLSM